jgi:hypothetical protein
MVIHTLLQEAYLLHEYCLIQNLQFLLTIPLVLPLEEDSNVIEYM